MIPTILKVDASNKKEEIELSSTIKYNEEDITIKVKITYENNYNKVTVTNGTRSGMYKENDTVNISANNIDNKVFVKWEVEKGNITIDNINNLNTSFTMKNEEILINAIYRDINACEDPNCVACPEFTNKCMVCVENYALNAELYCVYESHLDD